MDWQPIETMPEGRKVIVKTVTGLERAASRARSETFISADKWGPKRLHCWGPNGDLMAIAWKDDEAVKFHVGEFLADYDPPDPLPPDPIEVIALCGRSVCKPRERS